MTKTHKYTLPHLIGKSFEQYPDLPSLGFAGEYALSYSELKEKVEATMAFLERHGIKHGDKVALLGPNMPKWGISYLAITFMGAVVVPILPDFHPEEIKNILAHSDAKILFVSRSMESRIEGLNTLSLENIIYLEDFSSKGKTSSVLFEEGAKPSIRYQIEEDDLAAIIYTSGTTGKSKGVMLTHKNITFNALSAWKIQPLSKRDRMLSVLPLSHTYENTLGFILPLMHGTSVYYLRKPPTPPVLLPALKKVKPTAMLSVPLIMEKIYRNKILPEFQRNRFMKFIYRIPVFRKGLNRLAGNKLKKTFGGHMEFFGIGGAKLDRNVEKFLKEARFPYAIGYGLTESAPLLAGVNAKTTRLQSTGPAVHGVELKIHDPDPVTGEGEIWARGPNIMAGYYKDPEATKATITEDGWLKTGDLGAFDEDNFLFIKGREKNLIIGASGENIYPEEIESIINNFRHVVESLVIEKKGKLVALVHFNREELEQKYSDLKEDVSNRIETIQNELVPELHRYINSKVNKFSQLQKIIIQANPFQKTATQKIKRFMYHIYHKDET